MFCLLVSFPIHCFLVGWCTNKSYVIATSDLWLFIHASNLSIPQLPTPLPYILIGSYVLPNISYLFVSLHLLFREMKRYRKERKSEKERLTSNSMSSGHPQLRTDFSPGNPENVFWNSETENNRWWRPCKGSSDWHTKKIILIPELLAKNFPNAQLRVGTELSNHSLLSLLIMITLLFTE